MSGALLRMQLNPLSVGFADLHPWPEYGDPSVDQLLENLSRRYAKRYPLPVSPLLEKAMYFAEVDAAARRQNRNLFAGLDLPMTHELVFDDAATAAAIKKGFKILKIKIRPNRETTDRLTRIPESIRLRLDLNGQNSFDEFQSWWTELSPELRHRIDAVEDPWKDRVEKNIPGCPAYGDWIDNDAWTGKVMKPARDDAFDLYEKFCYRDVLFTHSLDHKLGRAAAIWEAARFYRMYPRLKQAGGFSGWGEGPTVKPTRGSGFGFDEELHSLRWERVL